MPRLSPTQLENLKKYKYSGIDRSLISQNILTPYWNRLVTLFPLTIAPNTITLSGLCVVCVNVITLLILDPEYTGKTLNKWVYYSWALGLFVYQSLDAIDGKQARRTGMAGPLGEMFDHGCDAINVTLEVLLCQAAFGSTRTWWTIASQAATLANFYLSTWEEYHTGTLYLSAFSGPVEGILMICAIYYVTGVFSPAIWNARVLNAVMPIFNLLDKAATATGGVQKAVDLEGIGQNELRLGPSFKWIGQNVEGWLSKSETMRTLQWNEAFMYFAAIGLIGNVVNSYINVIESRRKAKKSLLKPLLGLLPFMAQAALNVAWLLGPNIGIVNSSNIVIYVAYWGFTFSYQVSQLILAHITKSDFPYWNWTLLWSIMGAVDANAQRLFGREPWIQNSPERIRWFVVASALVMAVNYMRFAKQVIWQITEFIGIACFTVRHKNPDGTWVENDESAKEKKDQ